MKKVLYILAIVFFTSCQKDALKMQLSPTVIQSGIVEITKDTTINDCWDGNGQVLRIVNAKITGSGCLKNWIIDAAMTQQIFDTTIQLYKITPYSTAGFSCAWYGASPSNKDNWWNIQKSINTCIDNGIRDCFLPNGKYDFAWTLRVAKLVGNAYQSVSLHFYGDASFWDVGKGSTLNFTLNSGSAFNLQYNKGSEIDHINLIGKWKSPSGSDSTYYNTTEINYKDISGKNIPDFYRGFCIDGDTPPNGSTSGSTGNYIHEIYIGNFARLISMSENGITQNNDIEVFENIQLGDGKYGIVGTQAQEKGNVFRGIYSWGSIYSLINIGTLGRGQAGNYTFDGGNVAGRCINLLNVNQGSWFSSSVSNFFCESIKTVGNIQTSMPFTISNSHFDLAFGIGQRNVLTTNSTQVKLRDCTIRYYNGLAGEIWVHAYPSNFENVNTYLQTLTYK